MKKQMTKTTKAKSIYIVLVLMCILTCIFSVFKSLTINNLSDERLYDSRVSSLTDGWYTRDSFGNRKNIIDISEWRASSGRELWLGRTLPEVTNQDNLFIENNYNYMKVFIEGICVYDYSQETVKVPGNMTGHFITQIPLDSEQSGKELSIEISQPYQFIKTNIHSVSLGSGSAYITEYLSSHLELIMSLILMSGLSVFLFAACLWQRAKSKSKSYQMLRSLLMFLVISIAWIFTDSMLPQFLWGNIVAICVISFFCFMAIPIPVISFVRAACPSRQSGLLWLQMCLYMNIMVQGILYTTGQFSFVQLLLATHLLLVISVVMSVIHLLRFYRKNGSRYIKLLLFALVLLTASGVVSLILFYVAPQSDNSVFFRYSFLIFIAVLVYICVQMMNVVTYEHAEHKVLKELAYNDILTGTESRLAFEEAMEELRNVSKPAAVTIYVFDLNNLKIVNDTYGHKAGDIILKEASACLMKVYTKYGRIFRTGGDEFIVLVKEDINLLPDLIRKVKEKVEKENDYSEYPFMLSGGCASLNVEYASDIDLLLKTADKEMYKDKEETKKYGLHKIKKPTSISQIKRIRLAGIGF